MSAASGDELLAAAADPSRRRLLDLLLEDGEASQTALAQRVPFTRQAVAKHLAVLERAGLVERRRRGREVLYAVRRERLDEAGRAMATVAARWERRLLKIKELAEAAQRAGSVP